MTNTINNIYAKQIENKDCKMERKVTFILGTGRCGSTLAQRLINASPQAIIWGEHGGFLRSIATGYHRVLNSKNLSNQVFQHPGRYSIVNIMNNREEIAQSNISWMNDFDQASLKYNFINFIESIFCSNLPSSISCWGFKEILYGVNSEDRTLDMLIELFPKSRNLVITRHPFNTVISMLTAWHPDVIDKIKQENENNSQELHDLVQKYCRKWSIQNQQLLSYVHQFPDNFIWLRYEDFQSKFCNVVFDFIDIELPEDMEKVLDNYVWQTRNKPNAEIVRQQLRPVQQEVWKMVEGLASELGYEPYDI